MRVKVTAFDACRRDPWAIMPQSLENILSITQSHMQGDEIDMEAVAAKLGRPLENTRTVEVRDGVAIIPVTGPIFRFASLFTRISGATSVEDLSTDFAEAIDNSDVKAIIFDVDSPGGQVAGVQEFSNMIFEARGKKPMATYTGDLMASAGIWIGSATGSVFGAPTARIGSIGVVAAFDDYREAKKRAGVREFKFISNQSPRKQADPATEAGAEDIQRMVDGLADIFVSDMARNRGVTTETVESEFGQGAVMLADEAVQAGLIDGVSTFESVLESLVSNSEPQIITNTARASHGIEARDKHEKGESQMSKETEKVVADVAPAVDRDYLNANHAEIVDTIKAEGAESERERIKAVKATAVPGHDKLVDAAMFDGKTTAGELALQILDAEKTVREKTVKSIADDAPDAVEQDDDAEAWEVVAKPKLNPT